ncbi:MAG: flagellar hook-basal body complex protein FliE [Aminivibrio sp.]|jgi:flagellar hook-basal body complex protein FliE
MDSLRLNLMKLADPPALQSAGRPSAEKLSGTGLSFEELLEDSVKKVNALQVDSDDLVNKLATGDVDDISRVVLASQRAEFALRMITEVRNKLLDAYQQLGRMPV